MSDGRYNQAEWCNKELMDVREEIEFTRNVNNHLNNTVDRKVKQLDIANGRLQAINDAIRDKGTMKDIEYIMEWIK